MCEIVYNYNESILHTPEFHNQLLILRLFISSDLILIFAFLIWVEQQSKVQHLLFRHAWVQNNWIKRSFLVLITKNPKKNDFLSLCQIIIRKEIRWRVLNLAWILQIKFAIQEMCKNVEILTDPLISLIINISF